MMVSTRAANSPGAPTSGVLRRSVLVATVVSADTGVEVEEHELAALLGTDEVDADAERRADLPLVTQAVLPRPRVLAIRVVEAHGADVAVQRAGRELRVDQGVVHGRPVDAARGGREVAGPRPGIGVVQRVLRGEGVRVAAAREHRRQERERRALVEHAEAAADGRARLVVQGPGEAQPRGDVVGVDRVVTRPDRVERVVLVRGPGQTPRRSGRRRSRSAGSTAAICPGRTRR